jgi:ketosteroid isomerase-like protein
MSRHFAGRTLLILSLIAGAPEANCQEPGKNDSTPRKERGVPPELEQFTQQWYKAWLDKDAAAVERMMADDYVYVAPTGQAQDREAILRIIRSPGYWLHSFNRTKIVVQMLGDTAAVIRCRGQGEGDFEGKHFKDDQALMQVCARIRGQWKVVTEQATANKP